MRLLPLVLVVGTALPAWGTVCPESPRPPLQATGTLDVVAGDPVQLEAATAPLQMLILTHAQGQDEVTNLSRSLALEFGQNANLRQVVLIDGTRLRLLEPLVLAAIERSQPTEPELISPYVSVAVDFGGEQVLPLHELAIATLPGINPLRQSVALLLDAQGTVLAGFQDLAATELSIRQCLRTVINS